MSCEKKVNLIQSFSTSLKSDLKLEDLDSNKEFQENLEQELISRNLEIDPNESSPKFFPDLESNKLIEDINEINYQVIQNNQLNDLSKFSKQLSTCGILVGSPIGINQQINEKIEMAISKNSAEYLQEIKEIKSKMNRIYKESHVPKIIRELIKELKIYEINNEFKDVNLSYENKSFFNNGKFSYEKFNDEYLRLCKLMRVKYSDPNVKEKYLFKLFDYDSYDFNQRIHTELKNYNEEEIKEAIEIEIDDSIDEIPNHRLVCFFNKWREIRKKSKCEK